MPSPISIFGFILIIILAGCQTEDKNESVFEDLSFKTPQLIGFSDSGERIDTIHQIESRTYPLIISAESIIDFEKMFPFKSRNVPDSSYSSANDLLLIVDSKQCFKWKHWERHSFFEDIIELDEQANEIPKAPYQPSYDSILKTPVFIVNNTDIIQGIEHHDGRLLVIQEALTEHGEWQPIEYFIYSGCGNSFGVNPLNPASYLMFGIPKYNGDFKTKLRVRLRTNNNTILSNEFDGNINKTQLTPIEPDGIAWDRYLDQNQP
ncbi:hypothetical protein [Crocinitomix catalasitica]|uniref:hypothetical protein n=1 Tax=Crocinitomix catalasitica TaxID=184607 RepID=UPI000483CD61|nr:hypothetical protein [Crocinitomix catalasitica]